MAEHQGARTPKVFRNCERLQKSGYFPRPLTFHRLVTLWGRKVKSQFGHRMDSAGTNGLADPHRVGRPYAPRDGCLNAVLLKDSSGSQCGLPSWRTQGSADQGNLPISTQRFSSVAAREALLLESKPMDFPR